ncbi:DUF4139 domain-containing protein [Desulfovibrio sp.]
MPRIPFLPAFLFVLILALPARAADSLSLTVTSGGALVREVRSVEPAKGAAVVPGLPRTVDPSSIQARFEGGKPSVEMLRFQADPFQGRSLLQRLVGREVQALLPDPADASRRVPRAAVLLSADAPSSVLADGRIFLVAPEFLILPAVEGAPGPLLTVETSGRSSGPRDLELSYLAGGLGWSADYALELDSSGRSARLSGWITLENESGRDFRGADVRLLAGDQNRAAPRAYGMRKEMALGAAVADMAPEEVGESHVYTLPKAVDLPDGQSVRVSLLHAGNVPVIRELRSRTHASPGDLGRRQPQPLEAVLTFKNTRDGGLGLPLPAGVMRVFEPAQGGLVPAGEDRIGHTPRGRELTLSLGRSFGVSAERRTVSYERKGEHRYRAGFEIVLRNGSSEKRRVVLDEIQPGEWKLVEAGRPHSRPEAGVLRFELELPPTGDGPGVPVTYTVDVER